MKPVFQTRGGAAFEKITASGAKATVRGGNCFQAVLASFFEMPLEEVPDFVNDLWRDDRWFDKVQAWTRKHHGVHLVYLSLGAYYDWEAIPWRPTGWALVSGKSGRGHDHICVAHDGAIIHDPWLDPSTGEQEDGLVAISGWYVFVPCVSEPRDGQDR